MMEMPIRTGRRLQDVAIRIRERISGGDDDRQQYASIHRQRMTCSDSLRTFSQTQDWTSGMSMSPSGRFQVIEESQPRRKAISREGIRWDMAWAVIILAAVLFAAILLADLAGIGTTSRTLSRLNDKVTAISARNDEMKAELAYSSGDVSVCTEAVKLNLIAGNGARTIRLTAPGDACLTMTTMQAFEGTTASR